jgi:hypothetical protein
MKGRVDKSMGIVTRIAEALARIKPTEPLRFAKRDARKKRNYSDSVALLIFFSPDKPSFVGNSCVSKHSSVHSALAEIAPSPGITPRDSSQYHK